MKARSIQPASTAAGRRRPGSAELSRAGEAPARRRFGVADLPQHLQQQARRFILNRLVGCRSVSSEGALRRGLRPLADTVTSPRARTTRSTRVGPCRRACACRGDEPSMRGGTKAAWRRRNARLEMKRLSGPTRAGRGVVGRTGNTRPAETWPCCPRRRHDHVLRRYAKSAAASRNCWQRLVRLIAGLREGP